MSLWRNKTGDQYNLCSLILNTLSWKGIQQKFKKSKSEKSKSILFDFSTFLLASHLSTFRLFFFPLDSQRFKCCTFSCACSSEKASGTKIKKSKSKKTKSILFVFLTFSLRSQRFDFCTFNRACSAENASGKKTKSQSWAEQFWFLMLRWHVGVASKNHTPIWPYLYFFFRLVWMEAKGQVFWSGAFGNLSKREAPSHHVARAVKSRSLPWNKKSPWACKLGRGCWW